MLMLSNNPLFRNMSDKEIDEALVVLGSKVVNYERGEIVHLQGDKLVYVGVLLSGQLKMERVEVSGRVDLVTMFEPGEIFGEVYVFAEVGETPFSLIASTDCKIMLLDFSRVFGGEFGEVGSRLTFNLLGIVSTKALFLNAKLEIVSKGSIREKLMAFLERECAYQKSSMVNVPMSKMALANYIGVERTAMHRELSKMKEEGIIDYEGNVYKIL